MSKEVLSEEVHQRGPKLEAMTLWVESNEKSLPKLVPPTIFAHFAEMREKRPELFEMDENELEALLKEEGRRPSATDNQLRMRFWLEYDAASARNRQMEFWRVYSGVCPVEHLHKNVFKRPHTMAWILCPPVSYMSKLEEVLNFGVNELRDIMAHAHVDPISGKINTRLAEIKLKALMFLDIRVKGAITQKIEQTNKSISLTMQANEEQAKALIAALSPEQMQEEIRRLQKMREDAENAIVVAPRPRPSEEAAEKEDE